jgi:hypothetical protein
MTQNQKKHIKTQKGSAVVIALLLTGTLILIGVSLATLINNETRQIAETIRNGRATYLSEAGTEIGLLFTHKTPPGSTPENNTLEETYSLEPRVNTRNIVFQLSNQNRSDLNTQTNQFSFQINSRSNFLPIIEEFELREALQNDNNPDIRKNLFEPLKLNESVTIPLTDAKRFELEYYFALDSGTYRPDWDILLWKLFGTNANGETENLSEYFPAGASPTQNSNLIGSTSTAPARFGTVTAQNGFNCGTYFPANQQTQLLNDQNSGTEFITCGTSIQQFLDTHENNYLVLTNAVNTALFGENEDLFNIANINWRICTPTCTDSVVLTNYQDQDNQYLVPNFTKITSLGTHNSNSKYLYTSVNPDGFLPVFDFSIYRTKN